MAKEKSTRNGSLEFGDIQYEKKDRVARLTINRPDTRNALRSKTREELAIAFEDAWVDDEVGVIVLTGAGDKAFCAGGDLSLVTDSKKKVDAHFMLVHYRLATAMRCNGKPIIARVNGFCIGGGNELNMLCDLTVASDDSLFGQAGPWSAAHRSGLAHRCCRAPLVKKRRARLYIYAIAIRHKRQSEWAG
jgi:1,4-dihydroxy-2-naphthoyl-CoA synthase